ncbi:MAG: PIN domain-containing protein [Anaerolineae bacterium]|nr:PIN domain-containing protein [Anaerolineae bacterium]
MRKPDRIVYLDADVIISFLSGEAQRLPIIEAFFEEVTASKGAVLLITSVITQAEVSFLIDERDSASFRSEAEQIIDDFWRDETLLSVVELNPDIALIARDIQRSARSAGKKPLKPMDAIHLATAKWAGASQLFTYNIAHFKPHEQSASVIILEPYASQPRLTGL